MSGQSIILNNERSFILKKLSSNDGKNLGNFFNSLLPETRSRFAPHPLTFEYAALLCDEEQSTDTAERFILWDNKLIAGYFILEFRIPDHEAKRYSEYGIMLEQGKDVMFAPCVADSYQDRGLASLVMDILLEHCRKRECRSLVLLGGTQESNARAIRFYEKFGFIPCGGYHTEVYNIDMRLIIENS